jgi:Skp family chaperone for outer membrane proteins
METSPTETFDDPKSVEKAYDRLIKGYSKLLGDLQSDDDVSLDYVVSTLDEQSSLLDRLEGSSEAVETFKTDSPDVYEEKSETLEDLRNKLEEAMENELTSIEEQMDTLDQQLDLMDEYQQGEGNSYYVDETF